jgi:glycosyltransferase involved in cell wall biosynthesis
MARADVIMPVSDALHRNCVSYMGSDRHVRKIVTVRPGYDLSVFAPTQSAPAAYRGLEGRRIILFVGRITEPKGAYNLIAAFKNQIAQRFRDAVLVLVGVPEEPDRLRRALEGCGENVLHFGNVATGELPAFYSHAYVFAGPSENEPFGATFVEALACGTPVVSVAKGGPLEIVEHERTGLLCPDNSPGSIAQALERLLADGDLRERMACFARSSVLGRFGVDRAISDLTRVYHAVAGRRERNGGPDKLSRSQFGAAAASAPSSLGAD